MKVYKAYSIGHDKNQKLERIDWKRTEGLVAPPEELLKDYKKLIEDPEIDRVWIDNRLHQFHSEHGLKRFGEFLETNFIFHSDGRRVTLEIEEFNTPLTFDDLRAFFDDHLEKEWEKNGTLGTVGGIIINQKIKFDEENREEWSDVYRLCYVGTVVPFKGVDEIQTVDELIKYIGKPRK